MAFRISEAKDNTLTVLWYVDIGENGNSVPVERKVDGQAAKDKAWILFSSKDAPACADEIELLEAEFYALEKNAQRAGSVLNAAAAKAELEKMLEISRHLLAVRVIDWHLFDREGNVFDVEPTVENALELFSTDKVVRSNAQAFLSDLGNLKKNERPAKLSSMKPLKNTSTPS